MKRMLPRGYSVSKGKKITKLITEGISWQIYLTSTDSYVLAVTAELYDRWVHEFSLPVGLFSIDGDGTCYLIAAANNYLISSLEKGPFPENNGQVEAFSIAFHTSTSIYGEVDLHDAVYIEEYSLLLPTSFDSDSFDNKVAYGRWLTGGIAISIDSIKRVSEIMSWLPMASLKRSVELAGFEVARVIEAEQDEKHDAATLEPSDNETAPSQSSIEKGRFVLIGRPDLERFFNDNIIDIVIHQEQYKRMGIMFPGATVLYGPPGSGKTYAVERLSEHLGWPRFDIDSSTIASPYIHDTSKKISEVFQAAIKAAPSVLVIDEMEAFLTDRGLSGSSSTHRIEEVAEFLRRIPEAVSKGVLVFAMTNMIDSIDPAILRRGRFDHIIEVKMACADEIEALLVSKFVELPVEHTVDARTIAEQLEGRPMSDVAFILREAGRLAVKSGFEAMTNECFETALSQLPKKIERPAIGFVT